MSLSPQIQADAKMSQVSDHPIVPGSSESYLSQLRVELDYAANMSVELREKLQSVCQPQRPTAETVKESEVPSSPLADAFAQSVSSLRQTNATLRDILSRLDLP